MSENITESRLTEAEREYEIKYNEALKFFENKRYSIEQFDVINNPVRYIRILSVDKTVEANSALAAREQMQKALMALSAVDMRFNMIIRHCGSTTEVYVGTVCYGKNSAALFSLRDIFSGTVSGVEYDADPESGRTRTYEFDLFLKEFRDKSVGFFVGNPIVGDLPESGRNLSAMDEIISGSEGREWIL